MAILRENMSHTVLSRAFRNALFIVFLGIFLFGAPAAVLYTAGYRINTRTSSVTKTSTISLATVPKKASIFLSGTLLPSVTPEVIQRLPSGSYQVRFEKEGFHPWERTLFLGEGSTTYVTAPLFLATSPTPLEETPKLQNTSTYLSPLAPSFSFIEEDDAYDTLTATTLTGKVLSLGMIPKGSYSVLVAKENGAFILNTKDATLYLATLAPTPSLHHITTTVTAWTYSSEEELFAWTDGYDVHAVSLEAREDILLTRQSDPITSLQFAHRGLSLLLAGEHALTGIDLTETESGRMQTLLATISPETKVYFTKEGDGAFLFTTTSSTWSYLPITL